ncbi:MAG: nitroreductase [Bacteroidetes bacterium HGW-Bacteroidetes-11]|jgi:ferredoxin|nr:MAG: nitroreductase [Bacteroidetes bacterium HGW-Bacteroidetes-11]
MSVATSRTGTENARISINQEKCTACGLCVKVCKDFSLIIEDNILKINQKPLFGCIGCGHCVAVCPHDAIAVNGRTLNPEDFSKLEKDNLPDYESINQLLLNRRSTRDFKDKPVQQEIIDKILAMASTAPMGLPPSDVGVMVLNSKEKVKQFSFDFIDLLERMKWMVSPASLTLMRPFMRKDDYLLFKSFVIPMVSFFTESRKRDENYLLYDAPLAMMFYGNMSDPADPYIAATYATLAAESLGLGACMIGSVGPFLKNTGKDFKRKYGLPSKMRDSIIVIFGYPQVKFSKTIKRSFERVYYV